LSTNTPTFHIHVDGRPLPAYEGQTVAAALLAGGWRVLRHTPSGTPRGLFCGMGVCFDCLVTIDGVPDQRACMTLVRPGMEIALTPGVTAERGAEADRGTD
jgi:predicted molibdopterin-dependent oxidoreductase YjgC